MEEGHVGGNQTVDTHDAADFGGEEQADDGPQVQAILGVAAQHVHEFAQGQSGDLVEEHGEEHHQQIAQPEILAVDDDLEYDLPGGKRGFARG